MKTASADSVRAAIAACVLGEGGRHWELGEITLHPHQREGAERVVRLLDEYRGALLADDVGLGKTYVALAVARLYRDALVIAPAALRDAWSAAASRAGASIRFVSVESLGRRGPRWAPGHPELVVIDEAHHLRSMNTRRFAAASAVCASARTLLLTATPVQNRLDDLRAILSLFLGERAHGLNASQLARFVIRRVERDIASTASVRLPGVREPVWVQPAEDADCLDRIVSLPPPLPPSDGQDGGVLLTYTLVRQWASSRAALRAALRRRLARACAMEDALLAGRLPSRTELAAWCYADGAQQLSFPELAVVGKTPESVALLAQVRAHATAVRTLLEWLAAAPGPDDSRVTALRAILDAHPDERVVAFSEYADTVAALYRAMAPQTRAAMLTHRGGRVAGGALTRSEVLARLAPGRAAFLPERDRVDMLLTTDVLSEGVNLQEASVVVHLDLAWNPARLEQRVGRLRRVGAARDEVSVYVFAPPAPAERLLRLEERLRLKLGVAARTLGVAGTILPGLTSPPSDAAAPREERIAAILRDWRRARAVDLPVGAAVRASCPGAIACVGRLGACTLLAVTPAGITSDRAAVEGLLAAANGECVALDEHELQSAQIRIEQWLRQHAISNVVERPALHVARSRRSILRRVNTIARRAARHVQPRLGPLMRLARCAAGATLSAGAERVLEELTRAPMSDEAWLQAVGEFATLHVRPTPAEPPELRALLLLRAP
ncbi:MAG TPA: DEAD/DEAH box helicase [Gemmatimonadaceae bacterium]|nr:DEAD/DEAH box helicase [Gemmatimonadaceae bacterium]